MLYLWSLIVGFNSRTPGGVRLSTRSVRAMFAIVSIHAPRVGCDTKRPTRTYNFRVSIHAPWEGCDMATCTTPSSPNCFNSRTLGRVRQAKPRAYLRERGFNSRTLGRVRRSAPWCACRRQWFQFTHPGKGATVLSYWMMWKYRVSIHAPWEGCDRISKIT